MFMYQLILLIITVSFGVIAFIMKNRITRNTSTGKFSLFTGVCLIAIIAALINIILINFI